MEASLNGAVIINKTKDRHLLVVFFNEDFSKNIPALERIYDGRFPERLYIVPDHHGRFEVEYRRPGNDYGRINRRERFFCRGRRLLGKRNQHELAEGGAWPRIARVFGFKYYFQDFFWQARRALISSDADWYWFVADDVLLHPQISQETILEFFGLESGSSHALICEPYFRRDEWVRKFHGSYFRIIDILKKENLYAPGYKEWEFSGDPHHEGPNQKRVIAGCSDFFACHRSVLNQMLHAFHRLALYKIFVEAAIPNVLLSIDKNAKRIKKYVWEFGAHRGYDAEVWRFLERPDGNAFYHPAKLGTMTPEMTRQILRATGDGE